MHLDTATLTLKISRFLKTNPGISAVEGQGNCSRQEARLEEPAKGKQHPTKIKVLW